MRNKILFARVAPDELRVVTTLQEAYDCSVAAILRKMIRQYGRSLGILTDKDVAELEKPTRRGKDEPN